MVLILTILSRAHHHLHVELVVHIHSLGGEDHLVLEEQVLELVHGLHVSWAHGLVRLRHLMDILVNSGPARLVGLSQLVVSVGVRALVAVSALTVLLEVPALHCFVVRRPRTSRSHQLLLHSWLVLPVRLFLGRTLLTPVVLRGVLVRRFVTLARPRSSSSTPWFSSVHHSASSHLAVGSPILLRLGTHWLLILLTVVVCFGCLITILDLLRFLRESNLICRQWVILFAQLFFSVREVTLIS